MRIKPASYASQQFPDHWFRTHVSFILFVRFLVNIWFMIFHGFALLFQADS